MSYKLLNCTPHPIVIIKDGEEITINPSGIIVRVKTKGVEAGSIETEQGVIPVVVNSLEGISITKDGQPLEGEELLQTFTGVDGIITPLIMKDYIDEIRQLVNRPYLDVYSPDTSRAIRDKEGRIIGVPALVRISP